MTVTYTGQVANVRFGGFARLLLHWKGSIYKLVYRELLVFIALYASISLTYRLALNKASQKVFELVVVKFKNFTDLIPLTFVVGFYVSLVVTRWWNQYLHVPWPDPMMLRVGSLVHGTDDRGRMLRRTMMRYMALSSTLLFCSISLPVKKRFPTLDHIVEAGIMTPREKKMLTEEIHSQHSKYWVPLMWFTTLAVQARKENRIDSDHNLQILLNGLEDFRGWCGGLFSYDWISTPLVYTQCVTLTTYTFFVTTLVSRQCLNPEAGVKGHEVDFYVPFFTILQFIFYMGWVKVAEQLMNPFGEDDDDFDSNWLIDRNLQVSYLAVDELYCNLPPLEQDIWWDEIEPDIPYTIATVKQANDREEFLGSTAQLSSRPESRLEEEDMQIVSPMETIPEDIPEEEELLVNGIDGIRGAMVIKDKKQMSELMRRSSVNASPTPTERTSHTTKSTKPELTRTNHQRHFESNISLDKRHLNVTQLPDGVNFGVPNRLQDERRNQSFISQISDWTAVLNPIERDRQRRQSRSTSPNPSLSTQTSSKRRHRVFGEPRRVNDRFDVRSVRTMSMRGDSMTDVGSRHSDDEDAESRARFNANGKDLPDDTESLALSIGQSYRSQSIRDYYPRNLRSSRHDSNVKSGNSTPQYDPRHKTSIPSTVGAGTPLTTRQLQQQIQQQLQQQMQRQTPQPPHNQPSQPPQPPAHALQQQQSTQSSQSHKPVVVSPISILPGSTLHLGTPGVVQPQAGIRESVVDSSGAGGSATAPITIPTPPAVAAASELKPPLHHQDSTSSQHRRRTVSGTHAQPHPLHHLHHHHHPTSYHQTAPTTPTTPLTPSMAPSSSVASGSSPPSTTTTSSSRHAALDHHRTRLISSGSPSPRHSLSGAKDGLELLLPHGRARSGSDSQRSPLGSTTSSSKSHLKLPQQQQQQQQQQPSESPPLTVPTTTTPSSFCPYSSSSAPSAAAPPSPFHSPLTTPFSDLGVTPNQVVFRRTPSPRQSPSFPSNDASQTVLPRPSSIGASPSTLSPTTSHLPPPPSSHAAPPTSCVTFSDSVTTIDCPSSYAPSGFYQYSSMDPAELEPEEPMAPVTPVAPAVTLGNDPSDILSGSVFEIATPPTSPRKQQQQQQQPPSSLPPLYLPGRVEPTFSPNFPSNFTSTSTLTSSPSASLSSLLSSSASPRHSRSSSTMTTTPLTILPPSPTASASSESTITTLTPPADSPADEDAEDKDYLPAVPVEPDLKTWALDTSAERQESKEPSPEDNELFRPKGSAMSSMSLASTDDGSGSEYNTVTKRDTAASTAPRPGLTGLFDPPSPLPEVKEDAEKKEKDDK